MMESDKRVNLFQNYLSEFITKMANLLIDSIEKKMATNVSKFEE